MKGLSKVISSFLISSCLFFTLGYSGSHNYVNAKGPTQLRPLTPKEVSNFVKAKGITPIEIKNINNYTVILYETNGAIGYYGLASKQNGKLYFEGSGSGRDNSDITPVSIGLGGGSNNMNGSFSFYSFAWVRINESSILDKAYCAAIILDDNTAISEPIKGNKAIIIPITMGNSRITNLVIFDKNRKVLFKQKL